jgi:hypothetical protein
MKQLLFTSVVYRSIFVCKTPEGELRRKYGK